MLLILLGIGILLFVIIQIWRYRRLMSWRIVEGRITQFNLESFKQPQVYILAEKVRPVVVYSYEVDGDSYSGSKITIEDSSLISNPESKMHPWPMLESNLSQPVYIDPEDPNNSVLLRKMLPYRANHYAAIAVTGVLLIIIGVYINYA